jgi:hypothetical protein
MNCIELQINRKVYELINRGNLTVEELKREVVKAAAGNLNLFEAMKCVRHVLIRDGEVVFDRTCMDQIEKIMRTAP